ncbi:MAG: group II intron reverse transcriptase/maturase [Fimbriimonadaceae bacterium]|nr:group II intron reverse transcriptase/maturase [Fimbriimonadaceae bacterium]
MEEPTERQPASVSARTKQAGEVRSRWAWTEPTVWTDRMLEALEDGVKGGRWYSLHDKAFSVRALEAAFAKVKANKGAPGVDNWTISRFEANLAAEISRLSKALLDGSYRPQAVKRVWIAKPGSSEKRPLGIPTVRDRVVQTALRNALEPIFEREFEDGSYGFRPGRSCHQALKRVWGNLKNGSVYVADADLKNFFDTIPHELMLTGLKEKVSDGKILALVKLYLAQGVMGEDLEPGEEGTPQGSVISPLLANIALHGLDFMARARGIELVRYADDFVALCGTREGAASALAAVEDWTSRNGLKLHPEKTRLVDYGSGESFEFLGYKFKKGRAFPRQKSLKKLRDNIRARTPRNSGRSLEATVSDLNRVLQGWYRYFRHSYPTAFPAVDQFVRQRLRAILKKRKGRGRVPRGNDFQRWPNAYFHGLGLFSTVQAHAADQSSRR